MNLIPGFLRKAALPVKPIAADPVNAMRSFWTNGFYGQHVVNYNQSFKAEHALQHPAIFRCLDKIASTVSDARWVCRPIQKEDGINFVVEDDNTRAIQSILDDPSDTFTVGQTKYWMALNLAVFGNLFFKVGVSVLNKPNAIYPLQTHKTTRKFGSLGELVAYRVEVSNENGYIDIPTRRIAEKQGKGMSWAYHIFRASVDVLMTNNAPLAAATNAADIISLLMARAKDTASGMPNIRHIISTDASTTVEQENSVINLFRNAVPDGEASGQVGFISGSKVTVTKLDNGMTDIHSKMPLDDMMRQCGAIFGIPMSLLGISAADGSKYANNYIESRLAFIEDTIIPNYFRPIGEGLTKAICPIGYEIVFDQDSVVALSDERLNKSLKLKDVPFITDEEKRIMCGFPNKPVHGTLPPTPSNFTKDAAVSKPNVDGNAA